MTKDEFFEKYHLESSLAILDLDANDDQSEACYLMLLNYRDLPLDAFFIEYFDGEMHSELEFLEYLDDELDWIIKRAKNAKKFIKKRQKSL